MMLFDLLSRRTLIGFGVLFVVLVGCSGDDVRTEVVISNETGSVIDVLTVFVDNFPVIQLEEIEPNPHSPISLQRDLTTGRHDFEVVVDQSPPRRFAGTISDDDKTWIHVIVWSPSDIEVRILSSAPGID